ncbi:hypothetical protein V8C26DRAFT_380777 [Trichoderma gracile]
MKMDSCVACPDRSRSSLLSLVLRFVQIVKGFCSVLRLRRKKNKGPRMDCCCWPPCLAATATATAIWSKSGLGMQAKCPPDGRRAPTKRGRILLGWMDGCWLNGAVLTLSHQYNIPFRLGGYGQVRSGQVWPGLASVLRLCLLCVWSVTQPAAVVDGRNFWRGWLPFSIIPMRRCCSFFARLNALLNSLIFFFFFSCQYLVLSPFPSSNQHLKQGLVIAQECPVLASQRRNPARLAELCLFQHLWSPPPPCRSAARWSKAAVQVKIRDMIGGVVCDPII